MVNKKRVTFADILGFSLVSVVEIYPENWFPDRISEKHRSQAKSDRNYRRSQLKCLFDQPVNTEDFHRRVKREHVCLERRLRERGFCTLHDGRMENLQRTERLLFVDLKRRNYRYILFWRISALRLARCKHSGVRCLLPC